MKWQRSGLKMNEMVRIPAELLVTGDAERFTKAVYKGETKHGILLEFQFEKGIMTEEDNWRYKYFISWPQIYCGSIKLKTLNGHDIKAIRIDSHGRRIA